MHLFFDVGVQSFSKLSDKVHLNGIAVLIWGKGVEVFLVHIKGLVFLEVLKHFIKIGNHGDLWNFLSLSKHFILGKFVILIIIWSLVL